METKSLKWDRREAAKEDSQLRKGQWKPPASSKKRRRQDEKDTANDEFLPSDEDSEGYADVPYERDEPMIYDS